MISLYDRIISDLAQINSIMKFQFQFFCLKILNFSLFFLLNINVKFFYNFKQILKWNWEKLTHFNWLLSFFREKMSLSVQWVFVRFIFLCRINLSQNLFDWPDLKLSINSFSNGSWFVFKNLFPSLRSTFK